MNGAESLVRTLVQGGVEVCFTNPGTSEMHFVAALDRVDGIRCVLCLFEGVATGAADGYARMAEKPASTLLHLGPGLANGLANLHNAKRARSPVVNIVGEHATYHRQFDAPLTSDIEAVARPFSGWVMTSEDSRAVAEAGAEAVAASQAAPGQVATLILPADTAWGEGGAIAPVPAVSAPARIDDAKVRVAADALLSGEPTMLILGHHALRAEALELAGRICAKTGARMRAAMSNARVARGQGRVPIERVPYPVDAALAALAGTKRMILIGTHEPVAFFAYPDKPSRLAPEDCRVEALATPAEDLLDALQRLAQEVGADRGPFEIPRAAPAPLPRGALNADAIGLALGSLIPENAIVIDESVSTGRNFFPATHAAPPHDWLQLTGGAIGEGVPLAIGAAVACPDRKVIALQADGSAMYTVQGLWTQARENLDVLTLIWSNRTYQILRGELANVGAKNPGPKALQMLSLADPDLDWPSLAKGMGVDATRVDTIDDLIATFRSAVGRKGPYLIEVCL
jgi:acetolactate synthase-1/2/3 large subunit